MFFFFRSYAYMLIAAAVIPAVFLIKYVYKVDRLDREPPQMIVRLVLLGVISTYAALILEKIGIAFMNSMEWESERAFYIFEFFVIVGPVEELVKYLALRYGSWKSPHFNCQFDAIVYSVSTALGFAIWENIKYVFSYGLTTALIRAVTAVPGHASFGVFMGVWYGVAKRQHVKGNYTAAKIFNFIAWLMPSLIHGLYDYLATISSGGGDWMFLIFIAIMFFLSYTVVKRLAASDRYLDSEPGDGKQGPTIIDV